MILVLYFTSCKKKDVYTESDNKYFIKGSCYYTDAITGTAITTNTNITIKIKYKDSNEVLPAGLNVSKTGSSFEFAPLKEGAYIITAEYLDNASMILYRKVQEVVITDKSLISDIELLGSPNTIFIKGSIVYTNTITGISTPITTGLTGTITSVDDIIQLPNNGSASISSNAYTFGPLLSKRYELKFSYTDSYGQKYSKRDTIDLNTFTGPLVFKNYQLVWEPSTVLITAVTDSLNNPIAGAEVYLYNNYLFLTQYKANPSAAISNAITNANGIAVFTNVNPIKNFRYVLKKIANDTLTNFDTNFVPASELPLILNQVNHRTDIVKYSN